MLFKEIELPRGEEVNILDAAAQGASTAIMLVLNIGASLIAFLAFVDFLNGIIGEKEGKQLGIHKYPNLTLLLKGWLGMLAGVTETLTFDYFLGKIFTPVAFIMGVPWDDCEAVGKLVGLKTAINEFAAYEQLGEMVENGEISKRSEVIATFALCGFANPSSIGIQLGGLGAMAPERKPDLAQIVFRAFIAGCLTSCLNACVAGSLLTV